MKKNNKTIKTREFSKLVEEVSQDLTAERDSLYKGILNFQAEEQAKEKLLEYIKVHNRGISVEFLKKLLFSEIFYPLY